MAILSVVEAKSKEEQADGGLNAFRAYASLKRGAGGGVMWWWG